MLSWRQDDTLIRLHYQTLIFVLVNVSVARHIYILNQKKKKKKIDMQHYQMAKHMKIGIGKNITLSVIQLETRGLLSLEKIIVSLYRPIVVKLTYMKKTI